MSGLVKAAVKTLIPPLFLQGLKSFLGRKQWAGDFGSWGEALGRSTGYQAKQILDKQIKAQKRVFSGEFAFERDTVLFKEPDPDYKLLASFALAARAGPLVVVDFGGALGSTFVQHRKELRLLGLQKWIVVEQSHFVDAGREHFQDSMLLFEADLDAAMRHQPTVLFASNVLQYLENPFEMLDRFVHSGVPYLFLNKVPLNDRPRNRLTVQRVPASIYEASYPCWFFDEATLLHRPKSGYELLWAFKNEDQADVPSRFKGFLFRKRPS